MFVRQNMDPVKKQHFYFSDDTTYISLSQIKCLQKWYQFICNTTYLKTNFIFNVSALSETRYIYLDIKTHTEH